MLVMALAPQMEEKTDGKTMLDTTAVPSSGIGTGFCSPATVSEEWGAAAKLVISSDQSLSVPVLPAAESVIARVHVPLGSSPMKAPIAPSGTSGVSVTPSEKVASVTGPGGFESPASSSQSVPLKTSALLPPLLLEIV